MTIRERQILEILKKSPMISQQDLADMLKINRSSAAVHITNLMKKGYIQGKGYIISDEKKICVIGGSNIDLQGFPKGILELHDSNPGTIETSMGGVGRNIAENLARLSGPVRLLSAVGDDIYGKRIIEESEKAGIDMGAILTSKDYPTSMYLSIMDEKNEMKVAISQMDIYKKIDRGFIQKHELLIKNSSAIVIDANLEQETIEFIASSFGNIDIFADPVSNQKSLRLKSSLSGLHTLKPNIYEVKALIGIDIKSADDARKAAQEFLKRGLSQVFISMGKEGVVAADNDQCIAVSAYTDNVKSVTGAGDAFMAGAVDGWLSDKTIEEQAIFATAASLVALESGSTINPLMSQKAVQEKIKSSDFKITRL